MTTYFDISVAIRNDVPVWEGDQAVVVQRISSLERGDPVNITHLDMGAHTATHVDAPLHFIAGGRGVERLDLDALIGPARVMEFGVEREITAADLEAAHLPPGTQRLLCKTRNSRLWREHPAGFFHDFVGISHDGAHWLAAHGVRLVGIDYLSIERVDSVNHGAPVHRALLEAGVILLEGLDLSAVTPGEYTLLCLPVKINGADGAPCRAVLVKE